MRARATASFRSHSASSSADTGGAVPRANRRRRPFANDSSASPSTRACATAIFHAHSSSVSAGGGFQLTGDQIRGFGFSHDGSVDTLFRFVSAAVFNFPTDVSRRESEAFMLQFDNDLAPIVGQQVTLDSTNALVADPRIDLFIARAAAPFTSALLGGVTTECEVIVKGTVAGSSRGWVRLAGGLFQADNDPSGSALLTDANLRLLATSEGPLTYSCVAPGSGTRVGINRDLDIVLDGLDNCPGDVNDIQTDTDVDGLGDVCDPTPLPEPNLIVGLAFGTLALSGIRRPRSRRRVRDLRGAGRSVQSQH